MDRKHLIWHKHEGNATVVIKVLAAPFTFHVGTTNWFPFRRKCTRLTTGKSTYSPRITSGFKQGSTYVTGTRCVFSLQLCHSLLDLAKRWWAFADGWMIIGYRQHINWKVPTWRVLHVLLLKILNQTYHMPIHVRHVAAIWFSDSAHSRGGIRAEFLQGPVSWLEVIRIEMALYSLSETPDTLLHDSSKESSCPT